MLTFAIRLDWQAPSPKLLKIGHFRRSGRKKRHWTPKGKGRIEKGEVNEGKERKRRGEGTDRKAKVRKGKQTKYK